MAFTLLIPWWYNLEDWKFPEGKSSTSYGAGKNQNTETEWKILHFKLTVYNTRYVLREGSL